jgi:hypothetical protein
MWPLFKIDARTVCLSQFSRKVYEKDQIKERYLKNDYCTICIEFPQFVKKVAYQLKSPQSYKEFLQVKYSDEKDINSKYEIISAFSNSIEDLEEIFASFRDRDTYFLNLKLKRDFETNMKTRLTKKDNDTSFGENTPLRRQNVMKEEKLSFTPKY